MNDISKFKKGDRFKIVIANAKSIPIGTIVRYLGENKLVCGGVYHMLMVREDTGEEICAYDHWLEKIK